MNRSCDSARVPTTAKNAMPAALKLRSHGDETSSNEKQTRDSPRVQEGALIGIIYGSQKMVATSCLEHGILSVMRSFPIIPSVEAGGEISRKCSCSRRHE